MGTTINGIDDNVLSSAIMEHFSLTPRWITKKFGLDKPSANSFTYADVAGRGQVGQSDYPWEQLDELEWFKALV
jgi:S-adenosylmethionine synthetase